MRAHFQSIGILVSERKNLGNFKCTDVMASAACNLKRKECIYLYEMDSLRSHWHNLDFSRKRKAVISYGLNCHGERGNLNLLLSIRIPMHFTPS